MNEQQKAAIEEAAKIYAIKTNAVFYDIPDDYVVTDFSNGIKEVIEHPERYGLQPVNEWVKIEPDGSNLPILGKYKVVIKDRDYGYPWWILETFCEGDEGKWISRYSHYKEIDEEQPPTDVEPK